MIAVIIVICSTVDRCSQPVYVSVWICICYIYVYKIEWCHLYKALYIECCPWQFKTCITCFVSKIYRELFCAESNIVHPTDVMLTLLFITYNTCWEKKMERCVMSSPIGKRWIRQFLIHKWAVKIAMYIWWQVIQLCQSFYMCILVTRSQHVTYSHMSHKWLINNSTCDNRNNKHTITRYLTNGWVTMPSFHTDMSKILWQVINSR